MTRHALSAFNELSGLLVNRTPALLLDYDGTLTPIVDWPEFVALDVKTRAAVARLSSAMPVAVVSGRDRQNVSAVVGLPGLTYAGSHGFDVGLPDGRVVHPIDVGRLEHDLGSAEHELQISLKGIRGAMIRSKRFELAVHYPFIADAKVGLVEAAVARVVAARPGLRHTSGKKVFELRSALPWDKGRAILWLLNRLGLDRADVLPIYIGGDETDLDAFAALQGWGVGIFVGQPEDAARAPFWLEDSTAVLAFLERLHRHIEGTNGCQ